MDLLWLLQTNCCVLFFVIFCVTVEADVLPACQSFNFHYEYTECDASGGRWRVSVPKPGVCTGGAPNPPVRGRDCSFTCEAGQYLDINGTQDCKKCDPGHYSLGGGVRFDTWGKLPTGFSTKAEEFSNELNSEDEQPKSNCSKAGWQPRGDVLAAFTGDCTALLTYSAKLVRPGSVKFKYQYDDENTIFHFYVHNDQCEAYHDPKSNVWPTITKDGEYRTHSMMLKSGLNILYWKVIGMGMGERRKLKPVLIKEIEINGVAFTSLCSSCPAGTYSGEGASVCTPCPKDTFSDKEASTCKPCDADTEYAEPGSSKCTQRPSCTAHDYYSYSTPCDKNKHTKKVYTWKLPHICRTDLAGAAQLPAPGADEPCPPCNPGMQLNATGQCEFCPKKSYSTNGVCMNCPVNTVPQYGLYYNWFNSLPPHMSTSCMSMEKNGCFGQHAWEPEGHSIRTGRGHDDDAYLMLTLEIPGFGTVTDSSDTNKPVYGELQFVFQTNCTKECSFFFIEETEDDGAKVIKSWDGSAKRQSFTHKVYGNGAVTYSWAFEKESWETKALGMDRQRLLNDFAQIHSINVTNTLIGGASKCTPCPKGVNEEGCIPCPAGAYINDESSQCERCPANTAVRGRMSHGLQSCKPCGPGLVTRNHTTCYSDCHYITADGKQYDFSKLKGTWSASGAKLFTTSGTQYYHQFNFTLCGSEEPIATCYNNFTSSDRSLKKEHNLQSFVCRATIIPPKNPSVEPTLSAQPHELGDILVNVSSNHDNVTREWMNQLLTTAGWILNEDDTDVHFTYVAERPTPACPDGRYTVITMRCDVKERNNGTIELPPKCPDGTCDGCNFHIMWRSRSACPACKEEDYDVVPGECVSGDQIVYYYPPKHCILSGVDDKPKSKHQKCPRVPFEVEIALLVILGFGIIMCGLLVYCWKRNKKLEYKYMKLVHSSGSRDGELPAAETCALDENEDDEHFDQVKFNESKGKKLFNKIRSMTSKNDDPFESIKLTSGKHSL